MSLQYLDTSVVTVALMLQDVPDSRVAVSGGSLHAGHHLWRCEPGGVRPRDVGV